MKHPRLMTFHLATAVQDQLDSTTYYFGQLITSGGSTGENDRVIVFPFACTIIGVHLRIDIGTVGTNEDITFSIRKNATTDTLIGTAKADVKGNLLKNLNLSIPMAADDYVQIKEVTPAWVTNPLQMRFNGEIIVSIP